MCLIVTHVPSSKKAGRVVKCWKVIRTKYSIWIDETLRRQEYVTPSRGATIPLSGIMRPKRLIKNEDMHCGRTINGGFIHCYHDKSEAIGYSSCYTTFAAYAINVAAYGDAGDMICRTLYIPDLDEDEARRKRRVKLLKNPNVTDRQIEKEFCDTRVTRKARVKS